jgi:hypothetical protein
MSQGKTIPHQEWHDRALALLTTETQHQADLVRDNPGFRPDLAWVLEDLEYMGLAERHVVPIYQGAQLAGGQIWWSLKTNAPEVGG